MKNSTETLTLDQDDDVLTECVSDCDLEAAGGQTGVAAGTQNISRTVCDYCVVG